MSRLALMLAMLAPSLLPAQAQRGRTCVLVFDNVGSSFSLMSSSGQYTTWFSNGFRARCRGTTMVVTSDSAEYVQDTRVLTLVGRARYREDGTAIDANLMRYTEFDARLFADGNVRARMENGSTLDANQLHYFRPQPPVRPFPRADAFGNARLVLRDSAAVPDSNATRINADRLHMERDSLFYAGGRVSITRLDLVAYADSAETNASRQTARLLGGQPRIEGRGARPLSVVGREIDLYGRERQLQRLVARGEAVAVSDSLRLSGDTLDIATTGTLIDRVRAWGGNRARVVSPGRDVEADLIDLIMPGQRMRELFAFGRARADTRPDTAIHSGELDRLAGDTLVATFDLSVPVAADAQPPLRLLVARGNASAFFQMASRDPRDSLPTLNYAVGTRIQMSFESNEVQNVDVVGQVRGINLTPVRTDSAAAAARRIPPVPPTAPER
jgi:hypothetical protein